MRRRTPSRPFEVLFRAGGALRGLGGGDLCRLHQTRSAGTGQWTQEHDDWRVSQGMIRIDPRDYVWPVAPAVMLGGGLSRWLRP